MWISNKYMKLLEQAEKVAYRAPVPTQMVSTGEYMPLAQTKPQSEVEERLKALADRHGKVPDSTLIALLLTLARLPAGLLTFMAITFDQIEAVDNGARFYTADLQLHSFGASVDVSDSTMTVEAGRGGAVRLPRKGPHPEHRHPVVWVSKTGREGSERRGLLILHGPQAGLWRKLGFSSIRSSGPGGRRGARRGAFSLVTMAAHSP